MTDIVAKAGFTPEPVPPAVPPRLFALSISISFYLTKEVFGTTVESFVD